MTQFKCEFCGNIYELDKMVTVPINTSDETTVGRAHICEKCHSTTFVSPLSENTCVCCGEVIPEGRQVCLKCDLEGRYGEAPPRRMPCIDEWSEMESPISPEDLPKTCSDPKHTIVYERDSNPVDIHKIIDDAMEKRDRTVSIYIGEAGVSVNVYPVDHNKVQWIINRGKRCEDGRYRGGSRFPICSNCGYENTTSSTYCPSCGELMHGVKEVVRDEEET